MKRQMEERQAATVSLELPVPVQTHSRDKGLDLD